jgi:hypothetical protein
LDDFNIDPTASIIAEFDRLAIENDWKKKPTEHKNQRARFVQDEFENHFGNNLASLQGWQALCKAVGIAGIPSSITQCKKVRPQPAMFDSRQSH